METNEKPACRYGAKCYRKNANHLKQYSHSTKENQEGRPKTRSSVKVAVKKDGNNMANRKNSDECSNSKLTKPNVEYTEDSESKGKKRVSNSTIDDNDTKKVKTSIVSDLDSKDKSDVIESDSEDVKSNSWTYIKPSTEVTHSTGIAAPNGLTKEEIIKYYYLVDMPADFYSFFKFCESVSNAEPLGALQQFELKLVGPFDILSGAEINVKEKDLMLCHWRFFYDPPEFQTVLASDSGYHIGYWRDSPKEPPVFMASNNPNEDCRFQIVGENLFGAVMNYLTEFIKKCDPFPKTKAKKFQLDLQKWAEKDNFPLEKSTKNIKTRQKKVNSKTFHGAGIVVPVQKKTDVGYRPLCESDAEIKKICKFIIDADDDATREIFMDKLQPLVTFANIANDECDFGNSLELGIDLFCMGSSLFDSLVEHLLTAAYSLLNRSEFGTIIKVHLKNRRNEKNLSVL